MCANPGALIWLVDLVTSQEEIPIEKGDLGCK